MLPIEYLIYRDEALTDLAGAVAGDKSLRFEDHNCKKHSISHYYVVAVYMNRQVSPAVHVEIVRK